MKDNALARLFEDGTKLKIRSEITTLGVALYKVLSNKR